MKEPKTTQHPEDVLFRHVKTVHNLGSVVDAMQEYSDQQNAELRERVKELEESKAQDLSFLIEIRGRFKKSHLDVVQREYVEQMLSDWIAELEAK